VAVGVNFDGTPEGVSLLTNPFDSATDFESVPVAGDLKTK
jgi:hypothetical protein